MFHAFLKYTSGLLKEIDEISLSDGSVTEFTKSEPREPDHICLLPAHLPSPQSASRATIERMSPGFSSSNPFITTFSIFRSVIYETSHRP